MKKVKQEAKEADDRRMVRINRLVEENSRLRESVERLQAEGTRKDAAVTKAETATALNLNRVDGLKK
jgi:hypothetical protein